MARVFITGSSDGLGRGAAQLLVEQGHSVVLHARNEERAREAMAAVAGAETAVVGDLSSIAQTRSVAEQVNKLGSLDAVIHNAGVGYREPRRDDTEDRGAKVTGEYFFHMRTRKPNPAARDQRKQDMLLQACERFSGVKLAGS